MWFPHEYDVDDERLLWLGSRPSSVPLWSIEDRCQASQGQATAVDRPPVNLGLSRSQYLPTRLHASTRLITTCLGRSRWNPKTSARLLG